MQSLQNQVCILYIENISVWTSRSSSAQWTHVACGCRIGQHESITSSLSKNNYFLKQPGHLLRCGFCLLHFQSHRNFSLNRIYYFLMLWSEASRGKVFSLSPGISSSEIPGGAWLSMMKGQCHHTAPFPNHACHPLMDHEINSVGLVSIKKNMKLNEIYQKKK